MTGKDHFIDDSNEYKFRSFELNFYGKKKFDERCLVFIYLFFIRPKMVTERS